MNRRTWWVLGTVAALFFLFCVGSFWAFYRLASGSRGRSSLSASSSRVGVIEVQGAIEDSKRVLDGIREFKEDRRLKAVVVRVDSPGGAVGPSQEIYDAVRDLAKSKKVVVSMGSTAASGGFYIACAGEKVFANPGTLTGSIGVIFQIPNFQGALRWAGVQVNTLKAGKLKDTGNAFREMSPEEREYLQGVLTDVHRQFIEAVAEGRKLKVEEVEPYADGRVFTGRQAKEWKLVDALGGFDAAVAEAAKMAGLRGEPELQYPEEERGLLRGLLGDEVSTSLRSAARALSEVRAPGLQYRLPLLGW
ncbi:MAG TPA: signal peptide peptidase SppA [Myxococcaceae bacterium]|nr:signal peptide peptidase SppA [Myxococcaceae bacterium]